MKKYKLFIILTLLISSFFLTCFEARALEQVGKIVGSYTYGDEKLKNADVSIYLVGSVEATTDNYNYELLDSFKSEQVDYSDLTTEQLEAHTNKLYTIINANGIEPLKKSVTDQNGQFSFDGLKAGIYLIKVDDLDIDGYLYKSSPTLLLFPDVVGNGIYNYNLSVNMKTERMKNDNNNNDDNNNGNNNNNNNQNGGSNVNAPNTYDAIIMYVALFVVSAVLLAVLICYIYIYNKKRGRKENEKNEQED